MSVTLRSPKPIVMQSKLPSGKGKPLGIGLHVGEVARETRVDQPVAPLREHRCVDVGEHHEAALAHLARQARGQVAGAAGDIQRPLPRAQVGQSQREALPQAVRARRTSDRSSGRSCRPRNRTRRARGAPCRRGARAESRSRWSGRRACEKVRSGGVCGDILLIGHPGACPGRCPQSVAIAWARRAESPPLRGSCNESGRAAMSGPIHLGTAPGAASARSRRAR